MQPAALPLVGLSPLPICARTQRGSLLTHGLVFPREHSFAVVLMGSISHVFMVISPIAPLIVALYFLLAYPLYPYLLVNVIGPPVNDSGTSLHLTGLSTLSRYLAGSTT